MSLLTAPNPVQIPAPQPPTDRHWTRQEYYRLVELGVLSEDDHVELVGGRIVEMAPQNEPHATSISLSARVIETAFGQSCYARQQQPLSLPGDSEPEPDIAVVTGRPRDYLQSHPTSALLVIEVADTTLYFDRTQKAGLYASAGILDYWLLDVKGRVLEVRRNPLSDPDHPFGFRYGDLKTYLPGDIVTPLAAEGKTIKVSDLLP